MLQEAKHQVLEMLYIIWSFMAHAITSAFFPLIPCRTSGAGARVLGRVNMSTMIIYRSYMLPFVSLQLKLITTSVSK